MFARTKDGIYKLLSKDKIKFGQHYCYSVDRQNINQYNFISEESILKQTETIECDEFVYERQGYDLPQRCYQNCRGVWFDEQAIFVLNEQEISTIKGAIWTDKGLIYVAKMDDKGELELCQS